MEGLIFQSQGLCPCTSSSEHVNRDQKTYEKCCQPLHDRRIHAKTAEQLMRSRYSAYVLKHTDYLLETYHMDFQLENEREKLVDSLKNTQWLGLIVHSHKVLNATDAIVEFSAFFKSCGDTSNIGFEQIHERSSFVLVKNHWYYTQGEFLSPFKIPKNHMCFCLSGKKFKRCHGV